MKYDKVYTYNLQNLTVVRVAQQYDPIFCANDVPTRVEGSIESDRYYGRPDRTQYVLSTMGKGLYVMYQNGYTSEIRANDKIVKNTRFINNICGAGSDGKGIFVIDYLRFHRLQFNNKEFLKSITERFLSLDLKIDPNDKCLLDQAYTNLTTKRNGYQYPTSDIVLRFVSFVPAQVIYDQRRVYIPSTGLMLGIGPISEATIHPCSKEYLQNNNLSSDVKSYLELDIVDNHTDKEYWTRVGNRVIKLEPARNPIREEACYVNLYCNETLISSNKSDLYNTEEVHGIYHSREEAEYEGNMDLKLKEMKHENEKLMLTNDRKRLNQEIQKLRNENDRLALEKEKLAVDYKKLQFENDKLEVEKSRIALESYKTQLEFELTTSKYLVELNKLLAEVRHLKDKLTLFKYGAILDLIKKKMDLDHNLKINESKINYEEFKSTKEYAADMQSALSMSLRMGKMLTEVF